ncbi:MAG: chorismate mutase [Candidatus Bathyarchaeota archaeon]|nr:chorismate mutase [Candidatus Termiticorpusculum sp.]MCL1971069.1 chorismate mutase [Candidatus Termiticorpusculum sp.]
MEDLQILRGRIDVIDNQILKALGERVAICRKIGEYKKQHGLPVEDKVREGKVYSKVREKAVEFQLDPARIETLYHEIVNICSDIQK